MKQLIFETSLLNDPLFESLLDFGVSVAGSKELHELKDDLKRPKKSKSSKSNLYSFNKDAEQLYLNAPLGRLRFSVYDRIGTDRKFLIITEGKTDAQIIEHAFVILTDSNPYWRIQPIHETNGGAAELAKALENGASLLGSDDKVIGIFDNDEKGIQEFMGLRTSKFNPPEDNKRLRKHLEAEVYALKLHIPPFRNEYYQEEQKFNFFSIEHYFSDDILNSKGMIENTPIPGINKISSSGTKKNEF